jgi:hypothetical protein
MAAGHNTKGVTLVRRGIDAHSIAQAIRRANMFNKPMSIYLTRNTNDLIMLSEEHHFPRMELLMTVFPTDWGDYE